MNSQDWQYLAILLNRIGIIFNFVAGFLLAPEIIGLDRLARAEEWLEEKLQKLIILTQRRLFTFLGSSYSYDYSIFNSILLLLGFLIELVVGTVLAKIIMFIYNQWENSPIHWAILLILILLCAIALLILIIDNIIRVVIMVSIWLVCGFKFMRSKLKGNERLRSIVVFWGVLLFIFGNLFQFIGTY